jgi:Uma2 family endonuclease
VSFVSAARLPKTLEPIPNLAPDLAVEVLSESNTPAEIQQKLVEYFQSGTVLAWTVDPSDRTVAVYHAAGKPTAVVAENGALSGETVLPGFTVAVAEFFQSVPRS